MIVVTEIKYVKVDDKTSLEIMKRQTPVTFPNNHDEPFPISPTVASEIIYGQRFVTHDGREINIGLCEEARELLKMPNDCFVEIWKDLRKDRDSLRECITERKMFGKEIKRLWREKTKLEDRLMQVKTAGFWRRLKWLFTGVRE